MELSVFFSWQSDTPPEAGQGFLSAVLQDSIATANARLAPNFSLVLDSDTQRVPGAPAIVPAILAKIDLCSIFVADVTLTHVRTLPPPRKAPNPNVLLELGYGIRAVGLERVLLLKNAAFGRPEELPFDLRANRVEIFDTSSAATRDAEQRRLGIAIAEHLVTIVSHVGPPAHVVPSLKIDLSYRTSRQDKREHLYQLQPVIENKSREVIPEWAVELEMPRAVWPPNHDSSAIVADRSTRDMIFLRMDARHHSGPLYPGDKKTVLTASYRIDDAIFHRGDEVLSLPVTMTAYVGNRQVATVTKLLRDLQQF